MATGPALGAPRSLADDAPLFKAARPLAVSSVRAEAAGRVFLFLQGPHGLFFPRLGEALRRAGHAVRRINLNGGDRATWPGGDAYRGTDGGWPAFLRAYLRRERVTDLVLYGDNRPLHAAAIREARALGVRVQVFEEGYIRPDWVTLEQGGVNGHSRLPRDPARYRAAAASLPPVPTHPALPSFTGERRWAAFFYHAQVVLQRWRFPLRVSHRVANPVWEGISYLRRARRRPAEAARTREAAARLAGRAYFLFPLQLDADYQIRVHSPFGTMLAAIKHVLNSFAAHAPADVMLAIKEHPLDSGLKDWRALTGAEAERRGLAGRIAFLEEGDLQALVDASLGMVTVNSTSGTLGLAAGKPVKVLGTAVYDMPDITDQQLLDTFWSAPAAPDAASFEAYRRVLVDRCLLPGAFLSETGMDELIAGSVERLARPPAALG